MDGVVNQLYELMRHGHMPDDPDHPKHRAPVCPSWEWNPDYIEQYKAIVLWILGVPTQCQGHPILPHRGLWLNGKLGTGKSTLMLAVKQYCAITSDPRSPRLPCGMLWKHAKDIASEYEEEGPKSLDRLVECPNILIIDDLGTENLSAMRYGSARNTVEEVLSRRYDRKAMTMVTTNMTFDNVVTAYGARIYDRIRESMNVISFLGGSYRKEMNPWLKVSNLKK